MPTLKTSVSEIPVGIKRVVRTADGQIKDIVTAPFVIPRSNIDINALKVIIKEYLDAHPPAAELDPVFVAWLATNPLSTFLVTETDPVFQQWLATNPIPTVGTIAPKDYWSGTLTAYNAITTKLANTIYFIEE